LLPASFSALVDRVSGEEEVEPLERGQRSGLEVAEVGGRSAAALPEAAQTRFVVFKLVVLKYMLTLMFWKIS
jgi:hypothetical protein